MRDALGLIEDFVAGHEVESEMDVWRAIQAVRDGIEEKERLRAAAVSEYLGLEEQVQSAQRAAETYRDGYEKWSELAVEFGDEAIPRLQEQIEAAEQRLAYHSDLSEALRGLVERAATIFDDHIDYPQAVSHAELRATAQEFREALGSNPASEGAGAHTPSAVAEHGVVARVPPSETSSPASRSSDG